MKKYYILLAFSLLLFFAHAQEVNNSLPAIRFYVKNLASSKVFLVQFIKDKTVRVDSGIIKSDNDTLVLRGRSTKEEERYQLLVDQKFTFYPVLENGNVTELYFNSKDYGRMDNLNAFAYKNSPSSIDWNATMFYPSRWKVKRNKLLQTAGTGTTTKVLTEKDSLNKLIKDYYIQMLNQTKSPATVSLALRLLAWENTGQSFNETLDTLQRNFSSSEEVQRTILWFKTYKYKPLPKTFFFENQSVAPDFEFLTIKGEKKRLSSYRGYYLLLDFWASWCKPCRLESPYLKQAFNDFSDKKILIIQISIDQARDIDKWKKAIDEDGTGAFIHANKYPEDPMLKTYKIRTIPINYLIDPEGKIIASNLRGENLVRKLSEVFGKN